MRRIVKNFFVKTNTLFILDRINYLLAKTLNGKRNKNFKIQHPQFSFPPDYFLYETFRLNYKQYKEDGELTARELLQWTKKYLPAPQNILEWGCGTGRIIRHLPSLLPYDVSLTGTDINEEMIRWDTTNIEGIKFYKNNYEPPTPFEARQFDLIYALSVFTHIEASYQLKWIAEMHRISAVDAIFLFTTHGKKFNEQLSNKEKASLDSEIAVSKSYSQKGHRMMSTYTGFENFKKVLEPYFEILEYYDGSEYYEKVGGQDLWITRKK